MSLKVGVFDSGMGGMTVLSALRQTFRKIDFVYLGDTANVPYGSKSAAHIQTLAFAGVEILKHHRIDALVIACNAITSVALSFVEAAMHPLPVFGVIEPGVQAALLAYDQICPFQKDSPILILATQATLRSGAYPSAFQSEWIRRQSSSIPLLEQACPLLVPMIEEGRWIQDPLMVSVVMEYLKSYTELSCGVALLGCTHYPWIHSLFEKALPGWLVVNSAQAIVHSLKKHALFAHELSENACEDLSGSIEWIFTDPDAISLFAKEEIQKLSAGVSGK